MLTSTNFDLQDAHRYFSADCFNRTWGYIEKNDDRSMAENMEMLHHAIASLWHWSQREDVTDQNLSIGYWQVSRVYCLLKQPLNARIYGLLALKHAKELSAFYKGYAYETLARAAMLEDHRVVMLTHRERALEMLGLITDENEKQLLSADLESLL
jgi:hypothetical protein